MAEWPGGPRISHLVSRYLKAEFCVVIEMGGGGGGQGGGQGGAKIALGEQICQI